MAANSSTVPSRRIGTRRLDLGPDLGIVAAGGAQELGEVHEVRPDRIDLHAPLRHLAGHVAHEHVRRGASRGVERRARCRPGAGRAGDDEHLAVALLDHGREHRLQEVERRLEAAAHHRLQVFGGGAGEGTGDHPSREPDGRVETAEACEPGFDEPGGRGGIGQILHTGHDLDGRSGGLELLDETGLGIADHEVVAPLGHEPGERWTDVEVGVGHEGHPSGACRHGLLLGRCCRRRPVAILAGSDVRSG